MNRSALDGDLVMAPATIALTARISAAVLMSAGVETDGMTVRMCTVGIEEEPFRLWAVK